jgi:hydrogenase maturation factor HypE
MQSQRWKGQEDMSAEIPIEAQKAVKALLDKWGDAANRVYHRERAKQLAKAAAPAIRKQERQRVREALEKLPRYVATGEKTVQWRGYGDLLLRENVLAALDSREDQS